MEAHQRAGKVERMKSWLILLLSSFVCLHAGAQSAISKENLPPKVMREFRGAWVATVANIDWPSKPGLKTDEQKAELIALLDKAAEIKLNTIIFQVRPGCDAMYDSKIEPWSYYLTGEMGKAPFPFYDPLAFAVEECHKRGLELHAWFNPYRAGHPSAKPPISSNHISKTHPKLVKQYGSYLWLDPGEKAVQDYTTRVVLDVVKRYDIDGVHMDDYFYPYKEKDASGKTIEFPDEPSWKKYKATGGKLERDDWRRENVNKLMARLHKEIRAQKKWVKFGLSPFGIWRPGFPEQVKGLDAYDQLYADSKLWLNKGWVDYLAPQLYWAVDPPAQSFPALLTWWHSENSKNRHIFPGMAITKVGKQWKADEITREIEIARQSPTPGHIHWNISSLLKNPDNLLDKLAKEQYTQPALAPAYTWIHSKGFPKPEVKMKSEGKTVDLKWQLPGKPVAYQWVLQTKVGNTWNTEILGSKEKQRSFTEGKGKPEVVALTAIDRFGNASPVTLLTLPK
ncbi:MAG: glycoside hydrolase family 10 protein [Verrucomicrobiales bacterium]